MNLILGKFKWLIIIFGFLFMEILPDLIQAILFRINKPLPVWQHAVVILVTLLVIYFVIRKYQKYDLLTFDKSLLTWKLLGGAVLIYLVAQAGSYIGYQVMTLEGATETLNQTKQMEVLKYQSSLYIFLTTVILSPLCEELVFRGIIFKKLFPNFQVLAIIISSVFFTLPHLPTNIGSFLVYFIPGLTFSFVYYKTDKIEYPLAGHALNNLLTTLLFWAGVS